MSPVVNRINKIARKFACKTYLEIGVFEGETFFNIELEEKTGVDPDFRFNVGQYRHCSSIKLFSMTSDQFFSNLYDHCPFSLPHYDIVYIDGLHHFEQVLRDFTNSLNCADHSTIWIFDDTLPLDPWSAYRNVHKSLNFRKLAGIEPPAWHGDVFKFIFALHDFFPGFSYATVIDSGNPQTVVWYPPAINRERTLFDNFTDIEKLTYFDVLDNYPVLHPIFEKDLLNILKHQFSYNAYCGNITLERICNEVMR